jgi:hypothetical protein
MNNIIKEYLTQRFLKNNHTKYHKYCNEWINNVTKEQVDYFIKEKDRLNL